MKKITVLSFMMFLAGIKISDAQVQGPTVVSTSGSFVTNGTWSLSETIGELTLVKTFSGGGLMLTQGFQQPYENAGFLPVENYVTTGTTLEVFPVPATDVLNVVVTMEDLKNCRFEIYSLLGQSTGLLSLREEVKAGYVGRQTIDIRSLSSGYYFIRLMSTDFSGMQKQVIKRFEVVR